MASTKSDVVVVVRESFVGSLDDGTEFIGLAGKTRLRADHPAVKKWPALFEALEYEVGVESATRSPGEKRGA